MMYLFNDLDAPKPPKLMIDMRGEYTSDDASDWTPECTLASAATLNFRVLNMVATLNENLRNLCPAVPVPETLVTTATTALVTDGNRVRWTSNIYFSYLAKLQLQLQLMFG